MCRKVQNKHKIKPEFHQQKLYFSCHKIVQYKIQPTSGLVVYLLLFPPVAQASPGVIKIQPLRGRCYKDFGFYLRFGKSHRRLLKFNHFVADFHDMPKRPSYCLSEPLVKI